MTGTGSHLLHGFGKGGERDGGRVSPQGLVAQTDTPHLLPFLLSLQQMVDEKIKRESETIAFATFCHVLL